MALNLEELQALETQFDFDAQQIAQNLNNEDVRGTEGEDTLIGSTSNEAIAGLAGNDTLSGKSGLDTLLGGEGDDRIESNGGKALLLGDEGNDVLSALSDIDLANDDSTLLGGQGEDVLTGSIKDDLLFGGSEADDLDGQNGQDNLNGGIGSDTLNGGKGDDLVVGDLDDDLVVGGDGNDLVNGGEGNDIFYDTQGKDNLTAGEGSDSFILLPGTDADTILDFQDGQDKLVLVEDFPKRGLTFEQLEITDNNGNASISIADTGEALVELAGVSADAINAEDFTTQKTQDLLNSTPGMEMGSSTTEFTQSSTEGQNSSQPNNQNQNQLEQLAPEDQIGAVTSQGVEAMKVDEARDRFDVDGEGITIGLISDSFDRSLITDISANDDVLSGDLPGEGNPNGYNQPVRVLDDSANNLNFEQVNQRIIYLLMSS
jgi:Ca2+-binding RTX toxin-like protein